MKPILFTQKAYTWTNHSKMKMEQYRLPESRVKRVINYPERIEEGIAEGTIAVMKKNETSKKPSEIWVMYKIVNSKEKGKSFKIISAWRYPGVSPEGQFPEIPEDTLNYLLSQEAN
jgi:hypothetical protein